MASIVTMQRTHIVISQGTHTHINNGHIPDMYRLGSPHDVYEFKGYTPFRGTPGALGNGSQRCGGAASTSDGHDSFAFGNTEEMLRASLYGRPHRTRRPHDPPLDRRTGVGYVAEGRGAYADALEKSTC
jgi:hypothetical protein